MAPFSNHVEAAAWLDSVGGSEEPESGTVADTVSRLTLTAGMHSTTESYETLGVEDYARAFVVACERLRSKLVGGR